MTYGLDQGLHLTETYRMMQTKKISLIGPMVSSKVYNGRGFFIGGQYYYVLGILGVVLNWNPLAITVFLIFLDYLIILYFINWIRKRTNANIAIVTFLFFATNNFLIVHSRFFWNPHFLLPLSIIATVAIDKYISSHRNIYLALSIFVWGIAISFHYSAILWLIPLFIIFFKHKLINIKNIFITLIFLILGNLPLLIFELRHDFYNSKTLIYAISNSSHSLAIQPHYLVYPLFIFLLIYFLYKIKQPKHLLLLLILINLITISIFSPKLPYLSPDNWNYLDIKKTFNFIVHDGCPDNFNLASTIGGDTLAYDLRFLLIHRKCQPANIDQYSQINTLYLVAPKDRTPHLETVWEVSSFKPFVINEVIPINNYTYLYRLDKS